MNQTAMLFCLYFPNTTSAHKIVIIIIVTFIYYYHQISTYQKDY